MFIWKLVEHSAEPIYRQIMQMIKYDIAVGRLSTGDRLPSIRTLALHLKVNPNTIARAYSELEREGIIVTRQGSGAYVARVISRFKTRESRSIIKEMLSKVIIEAYHLGMRKDEIIALFKEKIQDIYRQ